MNSFATSAEESKPLTIEDLRKAIKILNTPPKRSKPRICPLCKRKTLRNEDGFVFFFGYSTDHDTSIHICVHCISYILHLSGNFPFSISPRTFLIYDKVPCFGFSFLNGKHKVFTNKIDALKWLIQKLENWKKVKR